MKISCTVKEFGQMVRDCCNSACITCALRNICDGSGIEQFIRANDIADEEGNHEGR